MCSVRGHSGAAGTGEEPNDACTAYQRPLPRSNRPIVRLLPDAPPVAPVLAVTGSCVGSVREGLTVPADAVCVDGDGGEVLAIDGDVCDVIAQHGGSQHCVGSLTSIASLYSGTSQQHDNTVSNYLLR